MLAFFHSHFKLRMPERSDSDEGPGGHEFQVGNDKSGMMMA
jgi:hypothetical protein